MSATEDLANTVVHSFGNKSNLAEEAIDPATVQVIIQLIGAIAPMIQQCLEVRKAKNAAAAAGKSAGAQVKEMAANPTLFQRVVLNNKAREVLGFQAFRKHGREIVAATLDSTVHASDDQIQKVLDEN